jgi:hypothetical protein
MIKVRLKRMGALSLLAIAALAASPTSAFAGQQRNGQQSTANAIARGNHARAVNNVHQSIYQIYLGAPAYSGNDGYPNSYDNPGYWNGGYGSGYGSGEYGNDGYGYWVEPQTQSSAQQATANAVAAGDNSTAVSNINQSNYQDQFNYPANYQSGYGNPGDWNGGYGW